MQTISIQGQPGSFHAVAAQEFFKTEFELLCCDTFSDTFAALASGEATYALSAIENSLYGSINEVYDLLVKHNFMIVGEVYLRVEQCLIGLPGATIASILEVHSHPVALAQCEKFLDEQLPEAKRFEQHDTAGSVQMVLDWGDPKKAAIASEAAAEMYGLQVLNSGIETNKANYTRFVVLQKDAIMQPEANKTSLLLKTDHTPGALYRALGTFAKRNLNLSKIESRPIIGKAWHYLFYLDIDHQNDALITEAILELAEQQATVTILGSYVAGSR
jgi:prephenate dehydratase